MKKTTPSKGSTKVEANQKSLAPAIPLPETASTTVQSPIPLSIEEHQHLAELEKVIDAKLGDFFEVGSAIMEIKSTECFARRTATSTLIARSAGDLGAATRTN